MDGGAWQAAAHWVDLAAAAAAIQKDVDVAIDIILENRVGQKRRKIRERNVQLRENATKKKKKKTSKSACTKIKILFCTACRWKQKEARSMPLKVVPRMCFQNIQSFKHEAKGLSWLGERLGMA